MADITIETMRQVHVPGVLAIENERFTTPWTETMFLQEVEENSFSRAYVAVENGQVVGYLVSWFLRREVHLLNIAVATSHERQGLGRRMLRFLIEMARREHRQVITLEVRESNEAAIRLYRSFGFAPVGIRRGYYQDDREDAVLMTRSVWQPEERN